MKHLSRLNKYFLKYKWWIIPGSIFVVISNIFGVVPAQVIGYAVDLITENIQVFNLFYGFDRQAIIYDIFSSNLLFFGLLVIALYLLRGLFLFFMRQTIILMSRHIEFDMKNDIYQHYQELSLGFYRRNNTGDLMNRATEDVNRVRMYVGPAIMYTINTFVLSVLIIWSMFDVNAKLAIYCLLPLPFLVVIIYYVNTLIFKKSGKIQERLSDLSSFVQERFSGIRIIKSYVREDYTRNMFSIQSNDYKKDSMSLVKVSALFYPTMLLLIGLSTILTIYIGGIQVMNGSITAGNIAEFIIYINQLTFPVTMLGWVTSLIQRAAASQKRINEFLDIPSDIQSKETVEIELTGNIKFNQVSFTYPDTGIEALKDVSFEINSGEFVAIIGKTGSGKSTLANLIMRMYDVENGAIDIDGKNIKALNLKDYRSQIGFVPQEVFLFSDTIKNNIAFGLDQVTDEEVHTAAKNASVYTNIIDFEEKFETMLGERGITLSGGQKQRVSIARALIKSPKILIFDDCLSAVDTKTEEEILQNLGKIMDGKTSILIAHRISTIKNADKILVLDNGKIIEQGTHNELLSLNGSYTELYNHQLLEEETRTI
ncbi:putative multidrug resistance ABC transporter ATP-binding/permease protein YheI [Pedobacter sp. Bi27]|uniref:ABC transporter ATP-binding protein n=1 Tax=unclassified Pedobacter TaxID=2628915 RepID=UPI001D420090|nr:MULTISPECIES: ABC transporter ATP-binding protein [unclassified Pedobacter]CAH0268051.1 putative multidrug resistance ABC transporter ATP-binding/permease protein YheI [Pedobacter sp. Bi36]CAH0294016.1 putative multidrug resistance ABC transporter ATP-binding/permease protein YheI [Pedobacter sp. Bi27]CAH0302452.1 putative multidrug resistance ABC transporter ATP-binding/permease protein YheI [Pedobacter sp. Bi126]